MLKLVTPAREPQQSSRKGGDVGKRIAGLNRALEQGVEAGNSIQRAVARGRRDIIDAHAALRRAATRSNTDRNRSLPSRASAREAKLVRRLADIHRRLLNFSASVELEIDRLDILREEIERLIGDAGPARR